jgi:aldehyde dehydrogenase (NAD+)
MLAWKVAPALSNRKYRCSQSLLKQHRLPHFYLQRSANKPNFLHGVVNIVTGDGSTGAALVNHPGIRQDRIYWLN